MATQNNPFDIGTGAANKFSDQQVRDYAKQNNLLNDYGYIKDWDAYRKAAAQFGVGQEQTESAFGYNKGVLASQFSPGSQGIIGSVAGAPSPSPAPAPAPAAAPTQQGYTDDQIRSFVEREGIGNNPRAIYDAAKMYGISADRLDSALRYAPGTSDAFIRQNNWESLGNPSNTALGGRGGVGGGPAVAAPPPAAAPGPSNGPQVTGGPVAANRKPPSGTFASDWNRDAVTAASEAADYVTWPEAQGWIADQWKVADDQTVSGRMNQLLREDGPALQQARARARIEANGRGMLNSAMAEGAATAAVMDKALQIATPDAQTSAAAAQANFVAKNQSSSDMAQARNVMSTANADRSLDAAKTAYTSSVQMHLTKLDNQAKRDLMVLDGDIKKQLATVEAQFKTQMQTSQSAATMYGEALRSIGQIMTDPNLDADAKQSAINQQMSALTNGLRLQTAIGNIPGLNDLLASIGATVKVDLGKKTDGSGGNPRTPESDAIDRANQEAGGA